MDVTNQATDFLRQRLEAAQIPPEKGARLAYDGSSWQLQTDVSHEGDTVYRDEGRVVLLVPESIRRSLANKTMGVRQTENGPTLYIE